MIEVICGPMFSGKTEELIRRLKRVIIAETPYIVFKPNIDSRNEAEDDGIATHDLCGKSDAHVVNTAEEMYAMSSDYKVVAIDEAQFFESDLYMTVLKMADEGKRVIISGLDLDYLRQPFPTMSNLLAIADRVDKINSICMVCKENASYSLRLVEQSDLMVIGGQDTYLPVCRTCYNKKKQ